MSYLKDVQADFLNRKANRWAAIVVLSVTVGYFIAHALIASIPVAHAADLGYYSCPTGTQLAYYANPNCGLIISVTDKPVKVVVPKTNAEAVRINALNMLMLEARYPNQNATSAPIVCPTSYTCVKITPRPLCPVGYLCLKLK